MASSLRIQSAATEEEAVDAAEIRRTVARELHDRVAQTLTSMLIELENFKLDQDGNQIVVQEMIGLQESTREVLNNLRRVLYDLRGEGGVEEGFVDAVRSSLARFEEKTKINTILSVAPTWPASLGRAAALNLMRIVEEALTNVRLHSGGSLVQVFLGPAGDGSMMVEVTDDGRGAEIDTLVNAPGLGMIGMRERALILGGRLEVVIGPGGGTSVRAILPKEQLA